VESNQKKRTHTPPNTKKHPKKNPKTQKPKTGYVCRGAKNVLLQQVKGTPQGIGGGGGGGKSEAKKWSRVTRFRWDGRLFEANTGPRMRVFLLFKINEKDQLEMKNHAGQ